MRLQALSSNAEAGRANVLETALWRHDEARGHG
jgi:hypothetical protein